MGDFCKQCGKELFTDYREIERVIKRMSKHSISDNSALPRGARIYAYPCPYHKGAKHLTCKPIHAKRTKGRKTTADEELIMEELSV